ncbi:MAG TPA: patatin-like phospholipase family protein [Vicinamibacterales bacterium]|nr:patatin-like phospholipase family protein [Vicinamibacterales bacterium]
MSESPYSPALRTAVVLTGSGTAGAYHAGVLRALHEAGVRVDLIAGRGAGALGAMFAAIDGSARLWEADGVWRGKGANALYGLRPRLRAAGWALAVAAACLALPVALLAGVAAMYLIGWTLALAGATGASLATNGAAGRLLATLFDPTALPTIVPRLAMLATIAAILILVAAAWSARRRGARHELTGLASLVGAPLDARPMVARAAAALWDLIRGAAPIAMPDARETSRRYAEMLAENVGQPGFRELLIVAHDLDARRDLTFALLAEPHRSRLFGRRAVEGDRRVADNLDLTGVGRDHALDALAGALALPLATDPHIITFAPEAYWRGESHRLCDRPAASARLLEEVAAAGVEQVVVVSAAPALVGPHALSPARGDARGRGGEVLVAAESAALRDAQAAASSLRLFPGGLFQVRPQHNALGPLDFAGCYDARSDRHQTLAELIDRGYEDAYRQFIEPIVGASGEAVAQRTGTP